MTILTVFLVIQFIRNGLALIRHTRNLYAISLKMFRHFQALKLSSPLITATLFAGVQAPKKN